MILEFFDGTQLEVNTIIGGPKLIRGVMRDTLQIEVDPSIIQFDVLKSYFKDENKCRTLFSYTESVDESTDETITIRNTIGEGYLIFVSISDEERLVAHAPGVMLPDETVEVYTVIIAQMKYNEYIAAFPAMNPEGG